MDPEPVLPQSEPIIPPSTPPARKFSPLLILAAVVLLVIVGLGGIWLGKSLNNSQPSAQPTVVPLPTQISTSISNEIISWKTYTNRTHGFSIRYPDKIKLLKGPGFSPVVVAETQIEHGPRIIVGVDQSDQGFIDIEIFENREKISVQEWWNKNFILMYGEPTGNEIRATKNDFSVVETTLDNHQGILVIPNKRASESLRYFGNNYLIPLTDKVFSVKLTSEYYGNQILSTFKFTSP